VEVKFMDYSTYKNSIMIWDKSAGQQVEFTLVQSNPIDVFGFLEQKQITIYAPTVAKNELGYQVYKPNIFSGYNDTDSSTTLENNSLNTNYVFSRVNGSLTPANLQPYGFGVILVESSAFYSTTFDKQLSIWDATTVMQKFARSKRSPVDYANIILARCFQKEKKNVFVFTNDYKQIEQVKIEGIKYLRPDKLFAWMCKDGYIDPRKGGWNFRKRQNHNNRWTNPNFVFKNNLR
jgi:hypothetical protein